MRTRYTPDVTMPPTNAVAASSYISDTVDLPSGVRAIWVSVTGDVTVDYVDGATAVLYSNVPVGRLSGLFKRIRSTGTTATVENLEF